MFQIAGEVLDLSLTRLLLRLVAAVAALLVVRVCL